MNQLALDLQPTPEEYRIPLANGLFALVDQQDFDRLSAFRWSPAYDKTTKTFRVTRQIVDRRGKHAAIIMSREIMGNPFGMQVDHKNNDTLDNRRSNLRICTGLQNAKNKRRYCNNKSGFKGVCWRSDNQTWRAYINVDKRRVNLG